MIDLKNQKALFFTVLALGIIGVVAYGYFKATPPAGNNTILPKIGISPASYDFGEIEFGKVVNYDFVIKNSGQAPLEIKRVATSCGCTTAKVSLQTIEPGQSAELKVTYDTAAMGDGPHGKGNQERIIYIKSNDPKSPQAQVTLSAFVR